MRTGQPLLALQAGGYPPLDVLVGHRVQGMELTRVVLGLEQAGHQFNAERNGVILRWEENFALVIADLSARSISIAVTGPVAGRRRLLAVIRSDFEHIHSTLKFSVERLVPHPDVPGFVAAYDKLVAAEREGRTSFPEYRKFATDEPFVNRVSLAVPLRDDHPRRAGQCEERASARADQPC